jgi:hypothetical protein
MSRKLINILEHLERFERIFFLCLSFSLMKKKQKIKAIRQPPFAPQFLSGKVVRSELPKPAALLPTYDS